MQMRGRGSPARPEPPGERPPGTGRRPALSLTGADPPDAAARSAGAGLSRRAGTGSEAGQPAAAESAEHGQPPGAARGARARSVRAAGVAPRPLPGGALPPPRPAAQPPPAAPGERSDEVAGPEPGVGARRWAWDLPALPATRKCHSRKQDLEPGPARARREGAWFVAAPAGRAGGEGAGAGGSGGGLRRPPACARARSPVRVSAALADFLAFPRKVGLGGVSGSLSVSQRIVRVSPAFWSRRGGAGGRPQLLLGVRPGLTRRVSAEPVLIAAPHLPRLPRKRSERVESAGLGLRSSSRPPAQT